jgi:hypothetical protein
MPKSLSGANVKNIVPTKSHTYARTEEAKKKTAKERMSISSKSAG